jgi:ribosome recycling factor
MNEEEMANYKISILNYRRDLNKQIKSNYDRAMLNKSQEKSFWKEEVQKANDIHKKEVYEGKLKKEKEKFEFIRDNNRIMEMKQQKVYVRMLFI